MIELRRFLQNPFDHPGISLDELLAFSTDHLQRLIAHNPGALWNARITATTTALAQVEASATDDQTKLGLRKARKAAKDAFRQALPGAIARIHGVVVGRYGADAPEVVECFPQGRKVFSTCGDDRVSMHLETLINGLTAHEAELGAAVVADAGGLLSTWTAVYAASESSTGAKATTQEAKKSARGGLQLELFKNLLTIALQFPRDPDKLDLYMQQTLLLDHPAAEPEPPAPPAP